MRRLRDAPSSLSALLALEAHAQWDVCLQRGSVTTVIYLMILCLFAFAPILPHQLSTFLRIDLRYTFLYYARSLPADMRYYSKEVLP